MKACIFLLFCITFAYSTEGGAQVTKQQPKITSKSISTHSKRKAYTPPVKSAKIQFDKLMFDLGTIKEDAVIEKSFEFTNVGERDLVIINTKGSCGCTVPSAPTLPIAPGEKGKIKVKYTARNKVGPQKPTITVITNGEPSIIKLNMEAWVEQIPGGVN